MPENTPDELQPLVEMYSITWQFFVAQIITVVIILVTLILGARATIKYGKGLEVPLWLLLECLIPVIFPIFAIVYFRKKRHQTSCSAD